MEMTFTLDNFSGPLDLLLHLIAKNKVSIEDIPVSLILDQYMEYLESQPDFDSETSSEFVIMAAQLVLIKSRLLLPKAEGDEDDPRAPLVEMLKEYQLIKLASFKLGARQNIGSGMFCRMQEPADYRTITYTGSVYRLSRAMDLLIDRPSARALSEEAFEPILNVHYVSIEASMGKLLKLVLRKQAASFDSVLEKAENRSEIVAIFLAVLELSRLKKITVSVKDGGYILSCKGEADGA